MSKKDKNQDSIKREAHRSRQKIKGVIYWAIGIGAVLFVIYLAVTAPKVADGEYESLVGLHYHAHMVVTVNGVEQTLPKGMGMTDRPVESPLHIHEADNSVHMEFEGPANQKVKKDDIRVERVFELWGKDFSSTTLMGNKSGDGHTIVMKVNGNISNEYEHYQMHDKDNITIDYK